MGTDTEVSFRVSGRSGREPYAHTHARHSTLHRYCGLVKGTVSQKSFRQRVITTDGLNCPVRGRTRAKDCSGDFYLLCSFWILNRVYWYFKSPIFQTRKIKKNITDSIVILYPNPRGV